MANLSNINNKFIVTDGGNVLIGPTGNTSYRLDVSGNIRVPYANGYFMDTTGTAGSNFVKTINDYETVVGTDRGSAGFAVIGNSNIRIGFGQAYTAAQTSLFINSSGDVGIGTTTMNTTLNLYSASNTQIGFQDASTGVGTADGFRIGYNGTYGQLWLFENADFRIATNNTQRFSIDNDGITTVGNRGSDLVYDPTAYQNDLIIERKNADGNNQLATIRFNVTGYTGQTTGEASIGAVQTSNASSADLVFGTRNNGTRSEKMRIDSSGDVGIGTDTPGTKLEIKKQIPAGNRTVPLDILTIFGYGPNVLPYTGSGGAIVFKNTSYTYGDLKSARIRSYIDSDSGSNRGAGLVFEVTNSNQTYNPSLFLKYDGNVGIGTTSPQTKLEVNGGLIKIVENSNTAFYGGDYVRVFGTQSYGFRNSAGSAIAQISLTGNSYFNGGNVGIGITNPQDKLHVNGDAIINSTRYGDYAIAGLDTTGIVVARVSASSNGQSAIVEFVASGNNGGYYNVVYSCYNGGGVWYYTKNVVGSGGNIEVAETNGGGSSTLVFYFRATSGGASYTPRVMMKGMPYNLVTF